MIHGQPVAVSGPDSLSPNGEAGSNRGIRPFEHLLSLAVRTLGATGATIVGDDDPAAIPADGSETMAATLGADAIASGGAIFVGSIGDESPRLRHLPPGAGVQGDIAACAAVPIVTAAGTVIGALCLFDARERTWTGPDREALASLASVAAVEMELRAAVASAARTEDALVHAQKMESLGVLAGGVSHDFNNLLTAILGFAGVLKRSPNIDRDDRETIELIEQAARRGADITGRLLAFSRGGLVRLTHVDLADVVRETVELVRPTLPRGLGLSLSLPEAAVTVEGDRAQLVQAVVNIVLNARDALAGSGRIDIALESSVGVATLVITDDGPGMDEATKSRIFEPFFTTKGPGSGTGLGLAITYGVVQGHHGAISLETSPGAGTSFRITLPLVTQAPPVEDVSAGDGNLVLVVDDDAIVRRATGATLAELGYNVVEAASGDQAVQVFASRPGRFSAVLLDLVMPGMTGLEAFQAMTAVRPDVPVIVVTGYAAESHIDDAMKRQIAGLLQKPFKVEEICDTLLSVGAGPSRPRQMATV